MSDVGDGNPGRFGSLSFGGSGSDKSTVIDLVRSDGGTNCEDEEDDDDEAGDEEDGDDEGIVSDDAEERDPIDPLRGGGVGRVGRGPCETVP